MKKTLIISESEKNRILDMHITASKNHYLSEQGTPQDTRMAPITSTMLTLNDGKEIEIKKDGNPINFTFTGNYAVSGTPDKSTPNTNLVNVKITDNNSLTIDLLYNCSANKIQNNPIIKNTLTGNLVMNNQTIQPNAINNLVGNPGLSTQKGNINTVLSKFCKVG